MRALFFTLLFCISSHCFSQYIGVKARYTETRLVDDSPNPPKRENHLILSFFDVSPVGVYTPTVLSNYDLWVYEVGLQYGSFMGGVLDSTGNNYDGYAWPAPKAVAYYNTLGLNYIDCNPNVATHYVVNGHELDCGFITVSYWDIDWGTGNAFEAFPAPNICLPYYQWPSPYFLIPGNVNFSQPVPATAPYNWYNFSCGGSLQLVIRGVLQGDTSTVLMTLPVKFANVRAEIDAADNARVYWSNMTESNILHYEVERSSDGVTFNSIGTLLPQSNSGGREDYNLLSVQSDQKNYYRIKAIETSGGFFYSTIINLSKRDKPSTFIAFPNPVTNGNIDFRLTNGEAGNYFCYLVNSMNQVMKQKIIHHAGGDIVDQFDVSNLPRGNYQLVLQTAALRFTRQIFVNF